MSLFKVSVVARNTKDESLASLSMRKANACLAAPQA
jgi:hypothetical protein